MASWAHPFNGGLLLCCLSVSHQLAAAGEAPPLRWDHSADSGSSSGRSTGGSAIADAAANVRSAVSASFSVVSHDPHHPADQVAAECERQREQLQERWLGRRGQRWQQRCTVVIHANENAYLRSVGWQAAMTRGVSKICRQQGRILSRDIVLVADPVSGELTALAHELTHLVLADRFTRQPPRWADEGIAMLADAAEKRSLHLRDLNRALERRCCPGVAETLSMYHYPQGSRLAAFYGQSLSLVGYLTEIGESAKVVDFVALAMERGYDAALLEVYGIADTAEFERRWRRHLDAPPQIAASTPTPASARLQASTR